jgi:uncharacterized protein (TIGR03437 family)
MLRRFFGLVLALLFVVPVFPRQDWSTCGTHIEKWKEELHLHRQSRRARAGLRTSSQAAPAKPASRDFGSIVVMSDLDGVVARRNEFNLERRTVTFQPRNAEASRYTFETTGDTYDEASATAGQPLNGLGDDDTRRIALPFAFPFFGASYREAHVNSDGNITFDVGDKVSSDRSVGRLAAGPARLAGLFQDLDASKAPGGIRVFSEGDRVVVSWVDVPVYQDFGTGARQTFQIRLFATGTVEFAYFRINTQDAVVGISPGALRGSSTILSFATATPGEYTSTIAERFGGALEVDITTASQKFYENHEDAYDYLVFYNNLGIAAGTSAVAWENTVRNHRTGYGDSLIDNGWEYGSAARLQAVINMGPLSQYPADPTAIVASRSQSRDTPLTVLAHEAGHLFLAFASVRDPNDPTARPLLGYQAAHWNFAFNSDASLMEGNRIEDRGPGVAPRFRTVGTVEGFSALDQYLMGLRSADEVPPTFLVRNPSLSTLRRSPQIGVEFDGERRDIAVHEIIQSEGRRTPDHTVSQRRFRFAIVLIVAEGTEPSAEQLAQVDRYRAEFERFFERATQSRAAADTSLRRSLKLSTFPASGVLLGQSAQATLSLERPASADLSIALTASAGIVRVPGSVRIPEGATSVTFPIEPVRAGVDEIAAAPLDPGYDSAFSKIQVSFPDALRITAVSGDRQTFVPGAELAEPVVVRVTDENNLPYSGVALVVSSPSGGVFAPAAPVTDSNGQASIRWTPGRGESGQLLITLGGLAAAPTLIVSSSRPGAVTATTVVNAAWSEAGIAPGTIATVWGSNFSSGGTVLANYPWPERLGDVTVRVNGRPARILYVSAEQVNFLVPADVPAGAADLTVSSTRGTSSPLRLTVRPAAPGLFFDAATGHGAILNAGTGTTTLMQPALRGGAVEIYCTGLGVVRESGTAVRETVMQPEVTIGGTQALVLYSGLAAGYTGLYQVNVRIPDTLAPGTHNVQLTVNGAGSNSVRMFVR